MNGSREITLLKYKRSDKRYSSSKKPTKAPAPAPAPTPTPKSSEAPIWCDSSKCHIYPLIYIHPGNRKVTDQYINGVIPLTETTPINRKNVAEMISLKETLEQAIKGDYDKFTIDGCTITKTEAEKILNESLPVLYNKFHDLSAI